VGAGTVLVVEDDDSVRRAVQRLLNASGVPTATYASAEALLAVGPAEGDVCVVTDLKLPGMSGLELLAALRRRRCVCPLILITAYYSASVREEAEHRGVAASLAKPLHRAAFLAAIRAAIEPPKQA
jgi:two-component system response regulator FixJ